MESPLRFVLFIALVSSLSFGPLLGLGWFVVGACGTGTASPIPPELESIGQLDPELVRVADEVRGRVLANPADVAARVELAMVLDANKLDVPAEIAWTQVCELAPDDARAWYCLSRVRERRGARAGALQALERALAAEPDYSPAHARHGRFLLEAGRWEEAEAALRRAIELDPESPRGRLFLARLQLERDRPADAIRALEPIIARNPREPYANGLMARAWARLGEAERAQAFLAAEERAGEPTGRDPWAAEVRRHATGLLVRIDRASLRVAAGDAEGALAELEPLHARLDELPVIEAFCRAYLALGDPDAVLALLGQKVEPSTEPYTLLVYRAQALWDRGDDDPALTAVDAAVRRNPADAQARALRGKLLFDLGRPAEAVAALEQARARGDVKLGTALYLGRAHARVGDLARGLRALEDAAERFPEAPKPWAYRAELLALEGRHAEARVSLSEAKRRGLEPALVDLVAARLEELEGEVSANQR